MNAAPRRQRTAPSAKVVQAVTIALTGVVMFAASAVLAWSLRGWREGADSTAETTEAPAPGADRQAELLGRGRLAYQVQCARCHGAEGHGDGSDAERLQPPPRDFASAQWRMAPTPESVRQAIVAGIPGTAMPGWGSSLLRSELDGLVAHVLSLAPRVSGHSTSTETRFGNHFPTSTNPGVPGVEPASAGEAPRRAAEAFGSGGLPSGLRPQAPSTTRRSGSEDQPASEGLLARLVRAGFVTEPTPRPAPELAVRDLDGNPSTLAQRQGHPVLVAFWGTSCAHCLTELPEVFRFAGSQRQDSVGPALDVLPVCVDETDAAIVREVAGERMAGQPLYLDPTGTARLHYDVQALPTFVLIDESGRLVARASGARDWSTPGENPKSEIRNPKQARSTKSE